MSKTPKFDALLDNILDKAKPCSVICKECQSSFNLFEEDIKMYRLLRAPPQKICPNCRQQRRLAFMNYSYVFRRTCQAPGHSEKVISLMSPSMPWIGYDLDYYNSDAWSSLEHNQEVKIDQDFLGQYYDLLKKNPHPLIRRRTDCVNSEYSFSGGNLKDCYYVFGSWNSENVMYSTAAFNSRDVVDSYYTGFVEGGYNNVLTKKCSQCTNIFFSNDCIASDFLYDCRNCLNCFGCVNLRNKSYCFFNEQLSKSEYETKRKEIDLGKRSDLKKVSQKFWQLVKLNPIRAYRIKQSNNVFGSDIDNCREVFQSLQAENSENIRYSQFIDRIKDSMDLGFSGKSDQLYEVANVGGGSSKIKFGYGSKNCIDCEYIFSCKNCLNCFGCVGLQNISYAIFNKVYLPDDYFRIVDDLKEKLLKDGTYGEFFPYNFSNFAYNNSLAQIIYPLSKEEILAKGAYWQDEIKANVGEAKTILATELPDSIDDVNDDLLSMAIISEKSGNPFRVVSKELEFYRRMRIALPTLTPLERMMQRFKIMSNLRIFQDQCFSCHQTIWSVHATKDGFRPYCEACYSHEVL